MNNQVLNEYFEFLWMQFQHDWSVFSNPWVLYTVLPAVMYFIFFFVKWWILLVPITLPLSIIARRDRDVNVTTIKSKNKNSSSSSS